MREPDVKHFKIRAEIKLTCRNRKVINKGWPNSQMTEPETKLVEVRNERNSQMNKGGHIHK